MTTSSLLPSSLATPAPFVTWLESLPPQTVLGPNPSLFLDPLPRFLKDTDGELLLVLPDDVLRWDGYGFATLERTPRWARVLLWVLDTWTGDEYTAADVLTVLRSLPQHLLAYADAGQSPA